MDKSHYANNCPFFYVVLLAALTDTATINLRFTDHDAVTLPRLFDLQVPTNLIFPVNNIFIIARNFKYLLPLVEIVFAIKRHCHFLNEHVWEINIEGILAV